MATHLTKLALIVEYDGTAYRGFQAQANGPTVQSGLERAIHAFTGETLRVTCASRTDAGVHATGQVVSFLTASKHGPTTFRRALNHHLPEDIVVREAHVALPAFHVQRDATGREYRYLVLNRKVPSPLLRTRALWLAKPLDVGRMNDAAATLLGERDFTPFAGAWASTERSTLKTLTRAQWSREGDLVRFDVAGNSFLYQQVRRIVGALLEVGTGKTTLKAFSALANGDKRSAGPVAPPQGLYLTKVAYNEWPPR
ncbi:MAG: tRNA pseudouridine(38-40) synthase TruA [Chloroflexi bacterium]|nr:tRNA pseudouridine(38-40) synthase TruA [Chloroflexota bacterium]